MTVAIEGQRLLQHGRREVKDLQGVVNYAPELATVHLQSVFLMGTEDGYAFASGSHHACAGQAQGPWEP
ncbi:hypothetical protein OsJ_19412 [Oryza sativa Japonica Group]|uniref:Uncharacterized protein n=1 Tax=Oryza sativa subsp. japonica TaxID=39947 RepID=B9FHK5_ORYSJ|nr:hypothetical protein OsJ_19412 [Oryza sativa Japonica Group]